MVWYRIAKYNRYPGGSLKEQNVLDDEKQF